MSLLLAGAGLLLVAGWKLTWFLTDDAFIAFRYVSNSILGHGYVWNAPPFRPVEGYTSFLWVALLDGIWRTTGVQPPVAANIVSLLCALGSLGLGTAMFLRLSWRPALGRWRLVLLALFLLGVTTHRTFVTWSSSGFETALFDLLVLGWLAVCLDGRRPRASRLLLVSGLAACLYLARPEGLLFAAATLGVLGLRGWRLRGPRPFAAGAPLLVVPLHLGWRVSFYGAWLPNTYHAKVVGAWPESGIRYLLSFVLEYALWFPLLVLLVLGLRQARQSAVAVVEGTAATIDARDPHEVTTQRAVVGLCLATLLAHFLYYTFVVGGDHFEYRVYSHLVVPGYLGLVWLAHRSRLRGSVLAALLATQVALALPVPWSHWVLSQERRTRAETRRLLVELAPHWPRPVRWYAAAFDGLQAWLIEHWVCVRHQEHKVNQAYLASLFPSRAEGERLPADGFPVLAFQAVGVASWTLPQVNILDLLGLNDYVIARTPVDPLALRGMAHERRAPPGYVDCFAPNVFLKPGGGGVRLVERQEPLTAERIEACERDWAARAVFRRRRKRGRARGRTAHRCARRSR